MAKKLGNYPATSVLITISTALFMVGLFLLFAIHATALTNALQENIEIQIYLEKDLDETTQKQLAQTLANQPFVEVQNGKPLIKFISKDDAAQKMIEETGENFIESLGTNPLRDVFSVNIKRAYYSKEKLTPIRKQLEATTGIYEVVYAESVIEKIHQNIAALGLIISSFVVILLIIAYILLNNAIKLGLFSQRLLIRSMQLVGATDAFIKKPFLQRAALQGFFGSLIACFLLSALLFYINAQIKELQSIQNYWLIALLYIGLLSVGTFICFSSAWVAVNRYLKMTLDELY